MEHNPTPHRCSSAAANEGDGAARLEFHALETPPPPPVGSHSSHAASPKDEAHTWTTV